MFQLDRTQWVYDPISSRSARCYILGLVLLWGFWTHFLLPAGGEEIPDPGPVTYTGDALSSLTSEDTKLTL